MKRWSIGLGSVLLAIVAHAQDLPTHEGDEAGEVDPPLLIQSRNPDGSLVLTGPAAPAPGDVDLEKLERNLARAKRGATGAEGLYRAGIISQVEAEERALRVVRLEAQLAQARLQAAQQSAEPDESAKNAALAQAREAAERANAERQRAELEAAVRNLERQKKLLALGSGRRADVSRAEQKLAELRQPHE